MSGHERRKRVSQACEPCRRKKSRCTGERPICSLCARLHQSCHYSAPRDDVTRIGLSVSEERSPARSSSALEAPVALEDRLGTLETKVNEVLHSIGETEFYSIPASGARSKRRISPREDERSTTVLPSWENVVHIAELYLLYCDCQPLPLFHRATFISSLPNRDPEIIYAILALAIRFSDRGNEAQPAPFGQINSYAEVARKIVMKKVLEGPVEISTLQCLCLLSLVEFTNGDSHRSSVHSSLAMTLARCSNLIAENQRTSHQPTDEERRRCFWSICLLRRFHGEDISMLDIADEDSLPTWPESTGNPPLVDTAENESIEARLTRTMKDEGIVGYVLILSNVFSRALKYVRRRGKPSSAPPWSSESEFSKIIASQMQMETLVPYTHRFRCAKLAERSAKELEANRAYWGPWFLNQFLYHTILCLLNHPLLISLSLRNYNLTIPEIFLQHSSDIISSHTTWIMHFIKLCNEKPFRVTDPFFGYSAAVVATIELQLSFTEDFSVKQEKQSRFATCVDFVRRLGNEWPRMGLLADKLQALKGSVSASYLPYASRRNRSLLIDLSRFWEILDYSSDFSDFASSLFGPSLYSGPRLPANEVSSASPLPEPTRIIDSNGISSRHASSPAMASTSDPNLPQNSGGGFINAPVELNNYDDFSMLAENFFSQGQDLLRNPEDWFNTGTL